MRLVTSVLDTAPIDSDAVAVIDCLDINWLMGYNSMA
jgi:hypothetical protein